VSKAIIYALNKEEQATCQAIGKARHEQAMKGRPRMQVDDERRVCLSILGVAGEMVTHKVTGLPWDPLRQKRRGDPVIGDDVHVATRSRVFHDLILFDDDAPNLRYVLVTQSSTGVFRIEGWVYGRDGMKPEFWQSSQDDRRPSGYFVPKEALNPPSTLLPAMEPSR
jgi:hypothetical protein